MPRLIRIWVPVLFAATGIAVAIAGGFSEGSLAIGLPILSVGLCMTTASLIYRAGVSGDRERVVEERQRAYFREHGFWPDEAPGTDRERKR